MERRVLIAIFLSFLVLYAYQAFVVKPAPKPAAGTTTTAPAQAPQTAQPTGEATSSAPGPAPATPAVAAPAATPLVGDTAERDVRIETSDVVAVFTNRGGRLKSWRLKHYLDPAKQPQELIDSSVPNEPLPFSLHTADEQVNATANAALYAVSGGPTAVVESAPASLQFEYRDSAGVHVRKTFRLEPSSYVLTYAATVSRNDRPLPAAIVWGPAVGDIAELTRGAQAAQGLLFVDGKVQRLAAKTIVTQPSYDGDFKYAGVDDNYFVAAALTPGKSRITYQPAAIPGRTPGEAVRNLVAFSLEPSADGQPIRFFVGPKDLGVLAGIDRDFTRAINFGMFSVIVVPLLQSLKWINGFVGNWGWSIVALTVIINVILFPLRHKSVVSMRKMQEIQPQVKAIQDRYAKFKATDPEKAKMNQEMMALYREKGVNPAGGCVPILLTLPIFIAMYALLSTAIELRGAPFFGWIHDLTAHDPYYITPVLMGLTQFWQQKITPAAGVDPAQQRMMMFMPAVMTFMFFWMPAGALLYYVVGNLMWIGQTYLTNRLIGPPKVKAVRPAAERRVKRMDGKTGGDAARVINHAE